MTPFRERTRPRELVPRFGLRAFLPRDDAAHGLENRARQIELRIEDVADHLLRIPWRPAIGKVADRHGPDVEPFGHEVPHLRYAFDARAGRTKRLCVKDDAILLDMRYEIASHALFVDRVEPVVAGHFVSRSGRGRKNLVEQANEVGGLEFLHRNIDGLERGDDAVAHRHEIRSGERRAIGDAHGHHDPEITHKERPIARQRRPRTVGQLLHAMPSKGLEYAPSLEPRQSPCLQLLGHSRTRVVGYTEFRARKEDIGEYRADHVVDAIIRTDQRRQLENKSFRADLMEDTLLLVIRAISEIMR